MIGMPGQRVGQAVITHIYHQVKIHSADRFLDDTLGFSRAKTRNTGINQISVTFISAESHIIFVDMSVLSSPFHKVIIDLASHFLAAFQ